MVKIVKFDNVKIIFLIFLFAMRVEAKYITYHVPCILHIDCSINMCKPPFQRCCFERACVCRLW
ncbi:unnamed protein product [Trifolium pratense]|uniref:Uncharacterized protein n=1 Tax=Trifolium pratense TaxID=57577 RepID=A0ACB0J5X7_TRIPR|nr:unnamed protein product [Trifolium pratense]